MHAYQSSAAVIETAQMATCPLKQVLQSSKPTRNALFSTAQGKTNMSNIKKRLCCYRAAKWSVCCTSARFGNGWTAPSLTDEYL